VEVRYRGQSNESTPIIGFSSCEPSSIYSGLPKFVELTNCGSAAVDLSDYAVQNFNNGVTTASATLTLTAGSSSLLLAAGKSFVISYENNDDDVGTSTFYTVYGFDADERTPGAVINGDDAIALVLVADGTTIIDVYGELGTDGTGEPWDYVDSYSVRKPGIQGPSSTFNATEWTMAGAAALAGATAAQIADQTSPGTHVCQQGGGGGVGAVGGPSSSSMPPSSSIPTTNVMPVAMPVTMPVATPPSPTTTTTFSITIPKIQGRYVTTPVGMGVCVHAPLGVCSPPIKNTHVLWLVFVAKQRNRIFLRRANGHGRAGHCDGRRQQYLLYSRYHGG
jgi:Lamin Tail Domain